MGNPITKYFNKLETLEDSSKVKFIVSKIENFVGNPEKRNPGCNPKINSHINSTSPSQLNLNFSNKGSQHQGAKLELEEFSVLIELETKKQPTPDFDLRRDQEGSRSRYTSIKSFETLLPSQCIQ